MSLLDKIFGDPKKPMKEANKYLDQIPGIAHQGYDPYITPGLDASGRTKSLYDELLADPTGFINKLMEGYEPSKQYQFNKGQLTKELSNTAAAGGVAGTPMDQLNQGQAIEGLLSQDQQQFLMNVLNVLGAGITGEEGIANRGYNATQNLTDTLGSNLGQKAGLAYTAGQQKNQNKQDLWKMFGKALGTAGGLALGGPAGALAGGALTSSMYGGG